ncbi:hypothetical protein KAH43_03405 [Candidatus Bipolaricaulota bacterium]|nr:hypothetical protein [Candidatus Bipolaricaulota bacterium]
MNRKFELSLGITVRILAVIALLAVVSTGISLIALQSARSDVAALTGQVDGLSETLTQTNDLGEQTDQAQSDMATRLDGMEASIVELPRFARADFDILVEYLSAQLASDAGTKRDELQGDIRELISRYESRLIGQSSFMNEISPLQVRMLVSAVDAEAYYLEGIDASEKLDGELAAQTTLASIKKSLIRMQAEGQYSADVIAVLQDQMDVVTSITRAALLREVRDAATSVAKDKGYDCVLDSAVVIQTAQSDAVQDITEEVKGYLE